MSVNIISRIYQEAIPGLEPENSYQVEYEIEGLVGYWSIPEADGDTDEKAKAYLEAREAEALENAENSEQDYSGIKQRYIQAMKDLKRIQDENISNWVGVNLALNALANIQEEVLKGFRRLIVKR